MVSKGMLAREESIQESNSPPLTEEDIHEVLSNRRRRVALTQLREHEERMTLRELSERIAELEAGESPAPRKKRQSVYVSLHQNHLPKLDAYGIVTYDTQEKAVQLEDRMSEVEVYLETVPQYGLSWSELYLGVGILGLVTVTGATIGTPGLSALAPSVWAAVHFLVIVGAAVYQTYQQGGSLLHRLRNQSSDESVPD